jgi:hypothetical protein
MNRTKAHPYDRIEKIDRLVHGVNGVKYEEPTYFPKNAGDLWKLKRNPTSKNSKYLPACLKKNYDTSLTNSMIVQRLIYLRFYGIDDYQR